LTCSKPKLNQIKLSWFSNTCVVIEERKKMISKLKKKLYLQKTQCFG